MEHSWILSAVYLLVVSAAVTRNGVAGQTHNDSAPTTVIQIQSEYFAVGKDANISCSNRTWSDALHFIWKINISGVNCLISESTKNPPHNNCTGGKTLRNTTNGESYLHIPDFGVKDEGTYKCEGVFRGGAEQVIITVQAAVPPVLSTSLERDGGQWFAVCSAAGGKPAAKVSWEMSRSSGVTERSTPNADKSVTVESWLHLQNNDTMDKLICVANQPSWTNESILELGAWSLSREGSAFKWTIPLIIGCLLIILSAAIFSYAARKHLRKFSLFINLCCKSDGTSSTESKQAQEVEEVEPYESYVQRVNSIYNSSADLFGV
ncbi:cell surface glycoprotein CD200 receptor 1-like isoform X1 [Alosa sapidissima]|uniref:cell surface glycoprotein CD200 receptor 1-like isoform X1 n=1 Tax=Alosa sapidissima TaxID=34773 RepID=UPI001C091D3C|nr:cell surface glycoprotein CD200 receptor 1-like isoform X1 [Alosa sapidissima]